MKFMAEEEIKAENQVSLTPHTDGRLPGTPNLRHIFN